MSDARKGGMVRETEYERTRRRVRQREAEELRDNREHHRKAYAARKQLYRYGPAANLLWLSLGLGWFLGAVEDAPEAVRALYASSPALLVLGLLISIAGSTLSFSSRISAETEHGIARATRNAALAVYAAGVVCLCTSLISWLVVR